ncbi:hypothetical protein GGS23DRAFT_602635 [Durotheca rogersii]|uniref:uncharacterized protein n=1 Tax=Durotheca rogersii TaxID=419775 RepID=UPI00221F8CD0|nr:uncharacterized protein GGS23DRAFT_602635 [Durotheca rogersii]KAI5867615.1 hypothetical protein GGS23DRAFT_602635 [Durotheca rogersii]
MEHFEPLTFEPLMSFNLPELLAVDLEESEDVFKSRQLTAGPPAPSLADDGTKRRYSLQDSSLSAGPSSHPLAMTSRAKSLQNVNETQAHFLAVHHVPKPSNSDSDSASSESSGGLAPPSIRTRDVSVVTEATSITSEKRESPRQLKVSVRLENHAGESWMDLDAEEAPPTDRRHYSMMNISSPKKQISLRRDMGELRTMSLNSATPRPELISPSTTSSVMSPILSPTSAKSPDTQEEPPTPAKKSLTCPTSFPTRRSSLKHRDYPLLPQISVSPFLPPSPSQGLPTQRNDGMLLPGMKTSPIAPPPRVPNNRVTAQGDHGDDDDGGHDLEASEVEQFIRPESNQTLQIAPPGVDVESWLESSVDNFPYYAQTRADGTPAPLPLPPEVLDTLRVSISCFPETMLLCSSLSIETIRGHSKKLRYKASSLYSEVPTSSVDLTDQTKQPKWRWLPVKKQPPPPSQTPSSPLRSEVMDTSQDPRYSPSWQRKSDWSAIQNLFPSGTDYLCDALYAHLVAYNYVTSLCPRSALINPTVSSSRPTSKSSTTPSELSLGLSVDLRTSFDIRASISDTGAIPRKAASLLGLQEDPAAPIPEPPPSRALHLRNKRSFFALSKHPTYPESSRPATATGGMGGRRQTSADHNEQALKDLRLGLAKCISRLVATLRMTNSGHITGADVSSQRKREDDPDFMRALCEIVRLSEERYM